MKAVINAFYYLLRSAFFFFICKEKKKKKPGEGELMHFKWTYMKKG
jgi:hypothetical protein